MSTAISPAALTGTYAIDSGLSWIGFVARSAVVSKVRGSFNEFTGTGFFDAENPTRSHLELTIQTTSLDSRNHKRAAHLRSADFFAVEAYPVITFVSTAVEHVDEWNYRVHGDLTIKGVTKPVDVEFEFLGAADDAFGNYRAGFEGETVLNRNEWGVRWN